LKSKSVDPDVLKEIQSYMAEKVYKKDFEALIKDSIKNAQV